MTRILVTGASGFIGSHVARALSAEGHEVLATGRDTARLGLLEGNLITAKAADLASDPLGSLVADREVIVHCAALSSPWGPRSVFEQANVHATQRLLDAAKGAGASRFVHFSSPSIYFRMADQVNVPEAFTPPAHWINAYAETKWLSERCVGDPKYAGMARVILRPRAVFGEGDRTIFPRIVALAEHGWFPRIRNGDALIDVTYVGNVADAVLDSLNLCAAESPFVFNLTNGEPMCVRELLEKLFASLDMEVRPVDLRRGVALALATISEGLARARPGRPEPRLHRYGVGVLGYSLTLDISRARTVLGYRPRVSIDEGIRRFSQWWKTHDRH